MTAMVTWGSYVQPKPLNKDSNSDSNQGPSCAMSRLYPVRANQTLVQITC